MKIIPAVDMKSGNCVRLLQGDFDRQTHYSDDPAGVARRFAGMGLTNLHLVDLDGAQSGRPLNRDLVRTIVAEIPVDVQVGGGIRDHDSAIDWLNSGAARVVIGSLAVDSPELVSAWLREFGTDRVVLALDCMIDGSGQPMLATHGWTRNSGTSLWHCIDVYGAANVSHVLCTDVSRDGAMTGPSFDLYEELRTRYPTLQIQASGGVRDMADLRRLKDIGIDAAITGRALLDGCISRDEVHAFLHDA